jgi:hypothetical protein
VVEDTKKSRHRSFERHLREETVVINGAWVTFFRDRKKRRWSWRALDAQVTLPDHSVSDCSTNPKLADG